MATLNSRGNGLVNNPGPMEHMGLGHPPKHAKLLRELQHTPFPHTPDIPKPPNARNSEP